MTRLMRGVLADVVGGMSLYLLSMLVFILGMLLGRESISGPVGENDTGLVQGMYRFDAGHYYYICERGYSYDSEKQSPVAFFPLYPMTCRVVAWISGCRTEWALAAVANACLGASCMVLYRYARKSRPNAPSDFPGYVVACVVLFPTSCFFRLPYSESLFLLLTVLAMLGMVSKWQLPLIAVAIGFATAARPVGVALLAPFLFHIWKYSATWAGFVIRALGYSFIASGGLFVYGFYLWYAFGDPLAFAKNQRHWQVLPDVPLFEKIGVLVTLEPLWKAYDPTSALTVLGRGNPDGGYFSLVAANPAIFATVAVLVGIGAFCRCLDGREVLLSAGLLGIPYVTKGYENLMFSTGRFAAVVMPAYIVLGYALVRLPAPISALLLTASGVLLTICTALYFGGGLVF